MPGVVSAVNALLDSNPETVNADPYGDGWLFELEMEEGADLDDLLDADAYAEQVGGLNRPAAPVGADGVLNSASLLEHFSGLT